MRKEEPCLYIKPQMPRKYSMDFELMFKSLALHRRDRCGFKFAAYLVYNHLTFTTLTNLGNFHTWWGYYHLTFGHYNLKVHESILKLFFIFYFLSGNIKPILIRSCTYPYPTRNSTYSEVSSVTSGPRRDNLRLPQHSHNQT